MPEKCASYKRPRPTRQAVAGTAPRREPCDLAVLLRETVDQLAPLAAERSVELHAELPAAPCQIEPASVAILATNLLANAIHQFAKRQMTWFRGMEKDNIKIHWTEVL